MRKTIVSALLVTLLLSSASRVLAKDVAPGVEAAGMKPVAVVSLSGYDKILSDIGFIGQISNNADLDKNLEGMLKLFTQGQGVNGLDRAKPWGVTVQTDGLQFQPLVFLPVTSLKQLLTSLAPLIGEARDTGDGIFELPAGAMKVYLKEQMGWAFIGQTPESLGTLPNDPTIWLNGLDKQYEVAIRLYVQNIPELYRSLAVDQLKATIESNSEKKADETDEDFELRMTLLKTQIDQMVTLVNETDQMTFGWQLDQNAKSTYLDVNLVALPGSSFAKQSEYYDNPTTLFGGFLMPDAGVTMNTAYKIAPEQTQQALVAIKVLRARAVKQIEKENDLPDEASKALAREIVTGLLDAMAATVEAGKADGGLTAALDEKSLKVIFGVLVTDPMAIETALKKLVKLTANKPTVPTVRFDAEQHAGVRFHTLVVPIKDEKAAKFLGDKLDVALGIGPKSAYLAVGTGSLALLKQAIDNSTATPTKPIQAFRMAFSLVPIMKFAASVDPNPLVEMMATELAKSSGKDHVIVIGKSIKNGVTYRIEAQEGVLKLIGQASKMAAGGAGAQGLQ